MNGKLFVFEGPDKCGKTTIALEVVNSLRKFGIEASYLSFPGREENTLGKLVYQIHHSHVEHGIAQLDPIAKQVLHIAAHIDTINTKIKPLIASGKTLILDRYWWSTLVYGQADGVAVEILNAMISVERLVSAQLSPQRIFLITREKPFNHTYSSGWAKLLELNRNLATKESGTTPVTEIRNDSTIDAIVEKITSNIRQFNYLT